MKLTGAKVINLYPLLVKTQLDLPDGWNAGLEFRCKACKKKLGRFIGINLMTIDLKTNKDKSALYCMNCAIKELRNDIGCVVNLTALQNEFGKVLEQIEQQKVENEI